MSVYDNFAEDYHLKRKNSWKPLQEFIDGLNFEFNGISIDLGCGNGRNFKIFKNFDCKLIGIDNSLEMIKIAQRNLIDEKNNTPKMSNEIELVLADFTNLPVRPNIIDNIFSIAAIHHIRNKSVRKNTMQNLKNLIVNNGYLLITVWRRWQDKHKRFFRKDRLKRTFNSKYKKSQINNGLIDFGDKYITWTYSKENQTYKRFYHFFSKNEIKKLLDHFRIRKFEIKGGSTNKDNFFIFAQKNK